MFIQLAKILTMSVLPLTICHRFLSLYWKRMVLFMGIFYAYSIQPIAADEWQQQLDKAKNSADKIQLALEAGDFYLDQDKPLLAKRYYEFAVTEGNNYEPLSLNLATALNRLASVQETKSIARTLYEQSINIYEKIQQTDSLGMAETLEAVIWTYDYTGSEFTLAKDQLKKAIEIRRALKTTKLLPTILRTLGWLYESQQDWKNAEKSYVEALDIERKEWGDEDIRVILAAEMLAQFYLDSNQYPKAEKFLWRKINQHKRASTIDYYNLGRSESMLGWTYLQRQYYKDAEKHFLQALADINTSMQAIGGQPSYAALPAILDLIYFYSLQNNFEKAKEYYDSAQYILNSVGDGNINDYAHTMEQSILSGEGISYPWSVSAQIDGIYAVQDYLNRQTTPLSSPQ